MIGKRVLGKMQYGRSIYFSGAATSAPRQIRNLIAEGIGVNIKV